MSTKSIFKKESEIVSKVSIELRVIFNTYQQYPYVVLFSRHIQCKEEFV